MAKNLTASGSQLKPDARYNSKLVSKFINSLMWGGKKSVAQRIFYDAMDIIGRSPLLAGNAAEGTEGRKNELDVFETAINNVKPLLEVRSKRVGGASYQIPMQVRPKRQQSLAFRWIIQSARGKKGSAFCERLSAELMDAYKGQGGAMTTRENVHKMAEANKAFAHFAW
ncbi:MAG: 30S ribosomal protein S7 [Phycisphaerae bacterium]|jgi:small subunit ribosomal protein S7